MTYAPGSANESCPAATGEADCEAFPDGAHRCGEDRGHDGPHRCTDSRQWAILVVPVLNLNVPPVQFRPPRLRDR